MTRFLGGLALLAAATCADAAFRVFPNSPHAGEEVVIQFDANGCGPISRPEATLSANVLTVTVTEAGACFPTQPPGATFVSVVTRFFAPGTYQVHQRVVNTVNSNAPTGLVGTVTVQGAVSPGRPAVSLNGLWLSFDEAGRGLNVIEGDSGRLFLIWFSYERVADAGTQASSAWYIASTTNWVTPTTARGVFYSAAGPADALAGAGFDASRVALTPLGVASVTVTGPDSLVFTLDGHASISPVVLSRNFTRFRF